MPKKEPEQITKKKLPRKIDVVSEAEALQHYWGERDAQMRTTRAMIGLTKEQPKEKEVKWVLNEPKVLFDTCVSLMSAYPPRFRLPLSINYTPEEKEKISKAERFLLGIFRSLDDRQRMRGGSYWLRDLAYWVASGWYSIFTYVKKEKDTVRFIADLFDPITVYPQWDARGLAKLARVYETDMLTAIAMADAWGVTFTPEEGKSTTKVINFWLRNEEGVFNAIRLGNQTIKRLRKEPSFDEIPVLTGAIGSPERLSPNWKATMGESVIASNVDMYKYKNTLISLVAKVVLEMAYPPVVTETETGEPAVKAEDFKGSQDVIPLKQGERMYPFRNAVTPPEIGTLLGTLEGMVQRGGLPYIVYGGIPFEMSGFAISQLMAAVRYKIAAYLFTIQLATGRVGTEFLTQYKKGNFGSIKLPTVNPREMSKGLFFVEEFSPEDVPDTVYVDVTIPLTSAMDKVQQITFARQAMTSPQLLSRETLWDELLDVQDSEQEYSRIIQDQTMELPIVKQIAMLEDLKGRVKAYRFAGKFPEAEALNRYIMVLEMQLGLRQGIPIRPGEASGIAPNVLPPEMGAQGAPTQDQINAVLGIAPPGISRKPQTPEERQAKGRLTSVSGENLI